MKVVDRFHGGALLLKHPRFQDDRGSFSVTYSSETAASVGLPASFVQDNYSLSQRTETLRGIHLQLPPFEQGKLVRVLKGRIFDVFVDLRLGSPTFGEHQVVELDASSGYQLWIPAGFGHGFLTADPDTEVFYKVDAPYRPDFERTLSWDDPALAIAWPGNIEEPHLSAKDAVGQTFERLTEELEGVKV